LVERGMPKLVKEAGPPLPWTAKARIGKGKGKAKGSGRRSDKVAS